MSPMNVALVMCPCWGREAPPLSISLLGGALRAHGIQTHLFDVNNWLYHRVPDRFRPYWSQEHYDFWTSPAAFGTFLTAIQDQLDQCVQMILETNPQVVGFSLLASTARMSVAIATRIKHIRPETIIMLGGAEAFRTISGNDWLRQDCFDALVMQEGDETLPQAILDLATLGSFQAIPGLIFKQDGQIIDGGPRQPVRKLDPLPFADYSDFDLSAYARPNRLDIYSSRSCIMRCHYCDESLYFERYRYRSGRNLFDEVVYQRSRHPQVNEFNFSDSVLNGSIPALRQFCELVIAAQLPITWGGQAVIRKEMTPELLRLMRQAGCCSLGYGVESGSDAVLLRMNKKLSSAATAAQVLRATHEAGITTSANFMFGYPTETEADFLQTLHFIRDNSPWIDSVSPAQSFMVLLPHTYLYRHPEEFGIAPGAHHIFWTTADGLNTYPIRLQRYEMFCKLCLELGLDGGGVAETKNNKWKSLGDCSAHYGDYVTARDHYRSQLMQIGYDSDSLAGFLECSRRLGCEAEARAWIELFHLDHHRPDQNSVPLDRPSRGTDQNWVNGIARNWGAAFFVADSPSARALFQPGFQVEFADGALRRITGTRSENGSLIVDLDGDALDGRKVGYPHRFRLLPTNSHHEILCIRPSTDANWLNGIARDWGAAFLVESASQVALGTHLRFHNGEQRIVTAIRPGTDCVTLFVDGAPLDGALVGYPHTVTIQNAG